MTFLLCDSPCTCAHIENMIVTLVCDCIYPFRFSNFIVFCTLKFIHGSASQSQDIETVKLMEENKKLRAK